MSTPGIERSNPLQAEFGFYLDNQDSLVEKHDGKVIVIKGCEVVGVYENELDAITNSKQIHKMGTFLIQRVSAGDIDYTATFHSRVAFP